MGLVQTFKTTNRLHLKLESSNMGVMWANFSMYKFGFDIASIWYIYCLIGKKLAAFKRWASCDICFSKSESQTRRCVKTAELVSKVKPFNRNVQKQLSWSGFALSPCWAAIQCEMISDKCYICRSLNIYINIVISVLAQNSWICIQSRVF